MAEEEKFKAKSTKNLKNDGNLQMKNGRPPSPEGISADLFKNGSKNLIEALSW